VQRLTLYVLLIFTVLVHSVVLQHFMCHRFLTVNLNRNINFIHGANGSGKSAILAALQITLGAKARYTHRANKLADFVQHEWLGNAEVSVKLLNTESDGYQYDLYGKSITVKRILSHSGPSTLALISDDGVVISKDRKEVSHS
jgi:structural maintenance of chromosomes protein 6